MTQKTERTRRITSEPIGPLLVRLTGTMILGVIAMMTLGFVDTWFISLLGTNQLAAIGFIIPIYMIFVSIALGIGMGISSITSRLIGEAKHDTAARYVTDAQILALLLSVLIAILVGFSINGIFSTMGANGTSTAPYQGLYVYPDYGPAHDDDRSGQREHFPVHRRDQDLGLDVDTHGIVEPGAPIRY